MNKRNQNGFAHILIVILAAFLLLVIIFVFGKVLHKKSPNNPLSKAVEKLTGDNSRKNPWGEPCHVKEQSRRELTSAPMKFGDIDVINPMGLMIGGHVTPIDHMYFYPMPTPGNRFAFEVRAMADGYITSVQHRGELTNGPANARPGSDEFRLTIEQTCNQGYYYDLITKLAPGIDKGKTIKSGDLVGYIGNQSLDFGVYDTEVNLNFIVPEHYQGEPWKIHTADAFKYFEPAMLKTLEPKITRVAEPRAGKIDFDKDGYLAGNWFEKGTNGYAGKDGHMQQGYHVGHLAFAYDVYDPTLALVSIGFLVSSNGGEGGQYAVVGNSPDPSSVNSASGLVKYQLASWKYILPDGSNWDSKTPNPSVKGVAGEMVKGTLLVQLTGQRELKLEYFGDKTASQVNGFTNQAKTYER